MPQRRRKPRRGRLGLALAGGGPVGAMYELGALRALEEAIDGLDLNDAWSYVGVSAGSFIASCLANGITVREMLDSVLQGDSGAFPLKPDLFFTPAYGEIIRRGVKLPRLALESLLMTGRYPRGRAIGEALSLLSQALPVGVFNNEPIREYLHELFETGGRTDDFRKLKHSLVVVAADLDAARPVRFGERGLDDVPISQAVQASTAVPGLYPPVRVKDHACVDGVLLKTVHASVALERGSELVFCINPLVPVDVTAATRAGRVPPDVLVALGMPAVLSQTFRTLIHSRLEVGLSRYASRYPDSDLILIEPGPDEYGMFFSNIFSFRSRVFICERGYHTTRELLLARYDELAPVIRSHGYELRPEAIMDAGRDLWASAGLVRKQPLGRPQGPFDELDRALAHLERAAAADARRGSTQKRLPARRPRRA
ncbi:MAG TPA: patatin-like phospholipase family protein [Gemmatimonadaceae bacterium]|nr:patatin-like phospholipase family protein [Gemmatimonadaceae bacterium]